MFDAHKARELAPVILRLGLTFVFIWFGTNQLMNAESWTGFVPEWGTFGLDPQTVVYLNGAFEVIGALMLGFGIFVRWVATLLALHLFVIASSLGLTPVGVRDFGLSFAILAVAFFGPDKYCLSALYPRTLL